MSNYHGGHKWIIKLQATLERDPETMLAARTTGRKTPIDLVRLKIDGTAELYQCKDSRIGKMKEPSTETILLAKIYKTYWVKSCNGQLSVERIGGE